MASVATKRGMAAVVGAFALLGAAGGYLAYNALQPGPPAVDLAGVEADVRAEIEAARRDVGGSPRSPRVWGRLGMILSNCRLPVEASTCFVRAEQLDPTEARWPYLRGLSTLNSDPETALACLRRAAAICDPQQDAPATRLAEALLQQGRWREAEEQFRDLLRKHPGHARALLGVARAASETGRLPESLSTLEPVLADPHTRKEALILKATLCRRQGDAAAAAEAETRAAGLPDDAPWTDPFLEELQAVVVGRQMSQLRVKELVSRGREDEADALVRQTERTYPDLYWLLEGRLLMDKGDWKKAESALRRSLELRPRSADASFSLGEVLFHQEDYAAAATAFRQVAALEPGHAEAYLNLGRCRERQGRPEEALPPLEAAVGYMPLNGEAQRELGRLLLQLGRRERAVVHLRNAVRLNANDAQARGLLTQAEARGGTEPP